MRRMKLTREERAIDDALFSGKYTSVSKKGFDEIAQMLARRRKDAVLNIRVNSEDLKSIKQKARRHGVKYQTIIAELLHRFAHS